MWDAGLDKSQVEIKIAWRNINNLRYDTALKAESEEELKSLLVKVKEDSENVGLKQHSEKEDRGIWSHHFMGNARLDEAQAGIKIAGRNINNFRYVYDTTLMAESVEELKSLWWKWKRRVHKLA